MAAIDPAQSGRIVFFTGARCIEINSGANDRSGLYDDALRGTAGHVPTERFA
jgi:hypothetical protein